MEKHRYRQAGLCHRYEPGTSYAYPVTIEREQKRVKQLQPGASAQFDLTYTLLHDSAQVAAVEQKIAKSGLKTWQTYQGPTKDFDEMVFNIQPLAVKITRPWPRWSTKRAIKGPLFSLIPVSCRS